MSSSDDEHLDRFIASMDTALRESAALGAVPPIEKRKLKTIASECGKKRASSQFLTSLQDRLNRSGIYTEPPLIDSGLRSDDWVLLSTGPFPAAAAFFSKESDLQRFVEACLGTAIFRSLEPFKPDGRKSCCEFRLPNGERIDLLCQERAKSGHGALVAIELKRERRREMIPQMIEYLDALKKKYPLRTVKGIIITGREDQVAATLLKGIKDYDIQWFCYDVTFKKLWP